FPAGDRPEVIIPEGDSRRYEVAYQVRISDCRGDLQRSFYADKRIGCDGVTVKEVTRKARELRRYAKGILGFALHRPVAQIIEGKYRRRFGNGKIERANTETQVIMDDKHFAAPIAPFFGQHIVSRYPKVNAPDADACRNIAGALE